MALGAVGDVGLAQRVGAAIGRELRAVGVNVNHAPVCDVATNPANPALGIRSFGDDPAAVARLATATVRGLQSVGVAATAKHFPGLGDLELDSHHVLATVADRAPRSRFDAVELVPFRAAIETGARLVMSAHVAAPTLDGDPTLPATLSRTIMTDLLRGELGFAGLSITDALDMGAIIKHYGNTGAAIMAVKAGADQLLQPLPQDVPAMIDSLTAVVQRGEISEARIDQSVRKILAAKAWLGLDKVRTVDLNNVANVVGKKSSQDRAQEAADHSITAVRDRDHLLPVKASRVLSVVYADDYDPITGRTFQSTLATSFPGLRRATLDARSDSATVARVASQVDSADVVLFSPFIRVTAYKGELAIAEPVARLIKETAARKPTAVITFGNPYVLGQFPDIGTYVLAWGQWDVSQRAAARALAGQIPITGKLPIAIPPYHKVGEGVQITSK